MLPTKRDCKSRKINLRSCKMWSPFAIHLNSKFKVVAFRLADECIWKQWILHQVSTSCQESFVSPSSLFLIQNLLPIALLDIWLFFQPVTADSIASVANNWSHLGRWNNVLTTHQWVPITCRLFMPCFNLSCNSH